jgi:predicted nucleic acid-binding Zn finger protein
MMNGEFESTLKGIKERHAISGSDLLILTQHCGDRFWKALQAVAKDLVKKYIFEPSGREAWVVVGKARDYRVLSELYCDCEDFYINVIVKRAADLCYHILAQILAESLETYSEIRLDDMRYDSLRAEWETLIEKPSPQKIKKGDP